MGGAKAELKEYRCDRCGILLFKADIKCATIEIKCRKCKQMIYCYE